MRAVLFYALLMLLIAMETIMLEAHSIKESRSEGQSNPGGCISDWRGLKKAYLDHQSSADVENSIFDFYPSDATRYGVLVMFYDVGPPPNTSTSGRRECCQRGNKDCIIHFIYRFGIFRDIHPPLLHSRAFAESPILKKMMLEDIHQLCWAPLHFCSRGLAEKILHEFTEQVSSTLYSAAINIRTLCAIALSEERCGLIQFIGIILQDTQWSCETLWTTHTVEPQLTPDNPIELQVIPILLFTVVGLCLVLYMHHSWGVVGTVLAHSQVARHTTRSTMLVSWILFPLLMMQFYVATKAMANTVVERVPFTLFQDVYSIQVTAGYVQWGFFLAILLLEAPFLFAFFFRKSTDLHIRKQQLSKIDCRLCYWIRVLCDTLGAMGVVAAAQITSVYLFHSLLYLTVSIPYTIFRNSLTVADVGTVFMCFVLLQQLVTTASCKCSTLFEKGMKCFTVLLLGLIYLGINNYFRPQLDPERQYTAGVAQRVLGSVVSSIIIGVYGYAVRKMLCRKMKEMERAAREDQEQAPLLEKGCETVGLYPLQHS